jgi:hypothetical protein
MLLQTGPVLSGLPLLIDRRQLAEGPVFNNALNTISCEL